MRKILDIWVKGSTFPSPTLDRLKQKLNPSAPPSAPQSVKSPGYGGSAHAGPSTTPPDSPLKTAPLLGAHDGYANFGAMGASATDRVGQNGQGKLALLSASSEFWHRLSFLLVWAVQFPVKLCPIYREALQQGQMPCPQVKKSDRPTHSPVARSSCNTRHPVLEEEQKQPKGKREIPREREGEKPKTASTGMHTLSRIPYHAAAANRECLERRVLGTWTRM